MHESIRVATPADGGELLAIYRPYVTDTTVTFEIAPPTPAEFGARIAKVGATHPWLVHMADGEITGYAYATRQFEREAYRYNASVSVYVRPEWHGAGVAAKLYDRLFPLLRRQGILNLYALLSLPNEKSRRFHARYGFDVIGVHERTGYKLGRWLDVMWMGKRLGEPEGEPGTVVPFSGLPTDFVDGVLRV